MKIGIVLLCKDENDYLDEWIKYHLNIGVSGFIIGDNGSEIPIRDTIKKLGYSDIIEVIDWTDKEIGSNARFFFSQSNNKAYDFLAFLDTDEFIAMSPEFKTIQDCLHDLVAYYDRFDALGLYWRFVGQPKPYFTERHPISDYTLYHENKHIKSILRPGCVLGWRDPHKATIVGRYIDELGRTITHPVGYHTSKHIWINHYWTRSIPEFEDKIRRGSGDYVIRPYSFKDFQEYNDRCTKSF